MSGDLRFDAASIVLEIRTKNCKSVRIWCFFLTSVVMDNPCSISMVL